MIKINQARCIACGRCAFDCFPGAIEMAEGTPALNHPENCIGCGHCIAVCPKNAVQDSALPMDDLVPAARNVNPADMLTLMRSRRSCRHYTKEPVTDGELSQLLAAARACPTAKNLQSTRYIAVTEGQADLLDLALTALGNVGMAQRETAQDPGEQRRAENFIRWAKLRKQDRAFDPLFFQAPLLLLFISPKGDLRDAAGAAAYTELMAAALGLGCLYSGYFTACAAGSSEIQRYLGLGEQEQVARCLVLGHPDIQFQRTAPRKPIDLTRK